MDEVRVDPGAGQCILVISQLHHETARRLRLARFWALRRKCNWEVLYVTPLKPSLWQNDEERAELQSLQVTALQLGATQVTFASPWRLLVDISALLKQRYRQNVAIKTILVLENERKNWVHYLLFFCLNRLLEWQLGGKYNLVSINQLIGKTVRPPFWWMTGLDSRKWIPALIIVSCAVPVIEFINYILPPIFVHGVHNRPLVFLVACAFVTGYFGTLIGICAAIFACVLQLLLFYPPYFSFYAKNPPDIVATVVFLLSAILLSVLTYNTRSDAKRQAELYQSLLRVHKIAHDQHTLDDAIRVLSRDLAGLLRADIAFFMTNANDSTRLAAQQGEEGRLSGADSQALGACWKETRPTGAGCSDYPHCLWRFEPLLTTRTQLGVMGFKSHRIDKVDDGFTQLAGNVADQAALILERLAVEQIAEEKRVQAERDQLRVMLLSSVSHDLKTPLASIIGSLSVIRSLNPRLNEDQRIILIDNALDEAQRLDSFVSNILDMTRLESDQVTFKKEWIDPIELVHDTTRSLRDRLRRHKLTVRPHDPPLQVYIDGLMFCHVLQNLLDNAVKYTPPGTQIEVSCRITDTMFQMDVRDHGNGIAPEYFEKIFDKYARIARQDMQVAGTGLGLALARTIMQNQGGSIIVSNHPDGGAVFSVLISEWREAALFKESIMDDESDRANVA